MRASFGAIIAAVGWLAAYEGASAADLHSPVAPAVTQVQVDGWQFAISPYVWAAGLSGNIAQFHSPTIHVSPRFRDILKNLDFAAMAIAEARYDRFSIFADIMYTKLSIGRGTPRGVVADRVGVSSQTLAGLVGVGYTVWQNERGNLDLATGVRIWHVSTDLSLDGGLLTSASFKDSATWANAMIGFRGKYDLTEDFYLTGWGAIGAGGARLDWDAAAGIGYRISDGVAAIAGYRALGVDYRNNGLVFDVIQHGPILGLVARF